MAAVLVMALVTILFFKAISKGKLNEEVAFFSLVPPDAHAILAINRPAVFDRMVLEEASFFDLFASQVPELFLSFIRNERQIQSMLFSFHPQGVVCYMQTGRRDFTFMEKKLRKKYSAYLPLKHMRDGIEYSFYPDTDGRFFGYYVHNGVWVGSYSKKLLENTADLHKQPDILLPDEMKKILNAFDTNAPLNVLFPTKEMNLRVSQGVSDWRIEKRWLGADMFINEGNLCCFGVLPYQPAITPFMYRAMGDTIGVRIKEIYPRLSSLSFEVEKEGNFVYYIGCTPLTGR